MGGVGKTELATQYARQHEADYPGGICWLNARDSNLAAEIVQFTQLYMNLKVPQVLQGRQLSPEQQVEWCWQNWRPTEGLVLVVLDGITNLNNCQQLIPKGNRFRVLMTTRLRNLDTNIEEISLDVLSPEEALQLLTKLVGEKWEKRVQKEEETAKQLCEWLGYLPLGLELVGGYLAKKLHHWTLAKMLQRLKQQRLQDEAINRHKQQLQKTFSTAQLGVLDAFELSWLELDPTTQVVGELLSLFAPDIFAWEWVDSATSRLNWDATEVETAVKQLYERHLIQWVEDKSGDRDDCYKIHPLIREFLKVKQAASEQADELKRAFAETMVAITQKFPEPITQQSINSVKDAIPHLAEVAKTLTDAVSDKNLILLFVSLGKFYKGQGLYASAQEWYEQCVPLIESRLGKQDPDFATSLNNLANLYSLQGRYNKAEPLYQQALALRGRVLGEEHPDFATSLNNLANLYFFQGRYEEAEALYKQALELTGRVLEGEHPDFVTSLNNLATSLNNLANLYFFQERYDKAEPLYNQALELTGMVLGEKHPDFATSLNSLANLYFFQRRYDEAELRYNEALEIRKRVLGKEHPDFATSLSSLAKLYESQERYDEAELLYNQALEITTSVLGKEHHMTVTVDKSLESLRNKKSKS